MFPDCRIGTLFIATYRRCNWPYEHTSASKTSLFATKATSSETEVQVGHFSEDGAHWDLIVCAKLATSAWGSCSLAITPGLASWLLGFGCMVCEVCVSNAETLLGSNDQMRG